MPQEKSPLDRGVLTPEKRAEIEAATALRKGMMFMDPKTGTSKPYEASKPEVSQSTMVLLAIARAR